MLSDQKTPDFTDMITEMDKLCPYRSDNVLVPQSYHKGLGPWKYWSLDDFIFAHRWMWMSFFEVRHRNESGRKGEESDIWIGGDPDKRYQ